MQLSAVDESEKDKVRKELELHHRKAEKGYKMLRDESQVAKESWDGKTRAFDREPCTIDATDVYTFDFQQNLPLPTLTVMCSIVNSGCITLASMTVSLIRVSCTFGMRQQRSEDRLKLHLVYIDVSHKEAQE